MAKVVEPIDYVPFLTILAQLGSMIEKPNLLLNPGRFLEFLGIVKNILRFNSDLIASHKQQQEKIVELERIIAWHENPHKPPRMKSGSNKSDPNKGDDVNKTKRKPGGQPGRKGITTVFKPDFESTAEFMEPCACGECKVVDIKDGKERTIVDYKVEKSITLYKSKSATCVGCGKERMGKFYDRIPIKEASESAHTEKEGVTPGADITADVQSDENSMPAPSPCEDVTSDMNEPCTAVEEMPVPQDKPGSSAPEEMPVPQDKPGSSAPKKEIKIPSFGNFGFSIILAVLLHWDSRSVIRRIGFQLDGIACISLSTGTTYNMLEMMAKHLLPELAKIVFDLMCSPCLYIDETTVWIMGKQRYVWVIASRSAVLYIPYTREGKVLLMLFAKYTGIVVSDGYIVYQFFKRRQRCWAHLMREAKTARKKANAEYADNFYFKLKAILEKAKEKKAAGLGSEYYDAMNAELKRLLRYYSRYEELMPVINYVRNDPDVWFTFMLYSYVDPTNNWAELMVREVVKQRIMRQTLRSVEGAWIFTTLLSCMGTWRLSGADIREQLEKYIAA